MNDSAVGVVRGTGANPWGRGRAYVDVDVTGDIDRSLASTMSCTFKFNNNTVCQAPGPPTGATEPHLII